MFNLRIAFRTLFKTPFVTVIAILSLALGIGANVAIFSLFDQILLRPLPVSEPGRLVNLTAPGPKPGSTSCNDSGDCESVFSYPMFRDLQAANTGMDLAAHRMFGANLSFRRQTLTSPATMVTGSYFPVLGVQPALGRLLGPADDRVIGGHPVAVLSHRYWVNELGSDPNVIDEPIVVNGQTMTVVGVAPEGFEGTTTNGRPRVFVPMTMRGMMEPGFVGFDNRRSYWAYVFGRLEPGVSIDQARTAINGVYRAVINDVEAGLQQGMSEQTMARFRAREVGVEPGARGQSASHAEARTPLILLFVVTGIVLFIACANIANLLLARGAGRRLEMAVRLSLGASRRQVLAQLLTESCVLALLGAVGSLIVAKWTLELIAASLPAADAEMIELQLRPIVLLFAGVLAIGTGLLFGMFPALHSTRLDLITTIRANAGQVGAARSAARFRTALVTAQIAMSMALLISAGLFLRSLYNITRVDLGLSVENLVTFTVAPVLNGYSPDRSLALFERLQDELSALPGVTGVTAGMVPVLGGSSWGTDVAVEGFDKGPDTEANSAFNRVGTGYFRTLGISRLAGREFTPGDAAGAPRVAIVNEAFARKFGLGRNAVGRFMSTEDDDQLDIQIVGLVADAKYNQVRDEIPPLFFTPYRQDEELGFLSFYVRTAGDPVQLVRAIPSVVAGLDPNLPVDDLKTMPEQVRESVTIDRLIGTLSAAFALLATLLAAVGLYGVLAYSVTQRTREIGVRIALGARTRQVRGMVLWQVGRMVLVGGIVGIAAAYALGQAASSLLFGMSGNDPVVFTLCALLLALVALSAGYLPALRASRIEPMQALRYD